MVRARDPKHRSRKLLLPALVRRDRAGVRGAEAAGRRGKRLDGSLRFLASGEKPRLEGKNGRIEPRSLARDDPRPVVRHSFDRRFDER
jgi:hypothetical protein